MEVRVEMDTGVLRAIMDTLSDPTFRTVASLALNDTIKNAQVETAQLLRPLMNIPSATIKAALSTHPATPEHLEAELIGGGKAIPMIVFHARDVKPEGVTINVAGKTERYRHAFIRTVKHGHVGVFERRGRERLPIRELYGPSVHGMMARTDVLPRVTQTLEERLLVNLSRQIDRAARKAAGHYGGA